jgi:hypothetical protein
LNDTIIDLYINPDEYRFDTENFDEDFVEQYQNITALNMTWTVMTLEGKKMSVEIEFESPFDISVDEFQD